MGYRYRAGSITKRKNIQGKTKLEGNTDHATHLVASKTHTAHLINSWSSSPLVNINHHAVNLAHCRVNPPITSVIIITNHHLSQGPTPGDPHFTAGWSSHSTTRRQQ